TADDMSHLPADSQEEPSLLFVVVAGIPLAPIEIELVAAHGECVRGGDGVGYDAAAVVDTAVSILRDPVIELQLEVFRPAAAPDDESGARDDGRGRDLDHERGVF